MVEIDADVIDVAKQHFQAVPTACSQSKLRVLVDDGMKFVRDTQEKFDLATLDLNDPVGPAGRALLQRVLPAAAPDAGARGRANAASRLARGAAAARRRAPQRLTACSAIVRVYIMYIPLYGSLCRWRYAPTSSIEGIHGDEIDRRIDARKLQERSTTTRRRTKAFRAAQLRARPGDP